MRWLLFLSRVAFIFGLCIPIQMSIEEWGRNRSETVSGSFLFVGFILAVILVPITCICYLVIVLTRRKPSQFVPRWLVYANAIMLLLIFAYIFYTNDPYYR